MFSPKAERFAEWQLNAVYQPKAARALSTILCRSMAIARCLNLPRRMDEQMTGFGKHLSYPG